DGNKRDSLRDRTVNECRCGRGPAHGPVYGSVGRRRPPASWRFSVDGAFVPGPDGVADPRVEHTGGVGLVIGIERVGLLRLVVVGEGVGLDRVAGRARVEQDPVERVPRHRVPLHEPVRAVEELDAVHLVALPLHSAHGVREDRHAVTVLHADPVLVVRLDPRVVLDGYGTAVLDQDAVHLVAARVARTVSVHNDTVPVEDRDPVTVVAVADVAPAHGHLPGRAGG